MDFLKRNLAPLSAAAWNEVDKRAKLVLKSLLSVRKFANVKGPYGISTGAVNTGRLIIHKEGDVRYGTYDVRPLVETRINFVMGRWELDNIERGAKDINYDALDTAVKQAAYFEEKAVFHGLPDAKIEGLLNSTSHEKIEFGTNSEEVLKNIAKAVLMLEDSYAEKPYSLIMGEQKWIQINSYRDDYNFSKKLAELVPGGVFISRVIDEAVMVPFDDENIEFSIGEDFAVGYQEDDEKTVKLFITESFTFRVLDKSLVVVFK